VFAGTYVLAAALYLASAARAPGGSDWGDFVAAASVLGIAHPTGYPVYLQILGLPLLLTPAAWAAAVADLTNALVVALAPAFLALWVYRQAEGEDAKRPALGPFAVLLGLLFAATPAAWLEATSVEVYGAAAALLFGVLLLADAARRHPGDGRFFIAAAFFGGLAAGVHLTVFAYVFVVLMCFGGGLRPPLRTVAWAAGAWLLGLSFILYLPLRAAAGPPLTWSWSGLPDLDSVYVHATGRQFSYNFLTPTKAVFAARLRDLAAAVWRSGGPLVILAPLGAWVVGRRSRVVAGALLAVLALNAAFLIFYDIPDIVSYQLPFVALTFACGAVGAATLFRALGGKLRWAAMAAAAVAAVFALATEWPKQRRAGDFLSYYCRAIVAPVGYEGMYASGTTTSNFLYWYQQYTLGRRPDVELYNLNDERFDIDKLAGLLRHEAGSRPAFADYFFVYQTHGRREFCRTGRPTGFVLELTGRETGPEDVGPGDAAALAASEALLAGSHFEPGRPSSGAEIALSLWEYRAFFFEYRGDAERAEYYYKKDAELAPELPMPHVNLARWYFDQGDYEAGRAAAEAALEARVADHNTYMAHALLAMIAQAEGDLDEAEVHALRAVALKPHDAKTHRLLAGIYLARGDVEAAREKLERVLEIGYNDPDTVLMLARIYRTEGREEDAFKVLAENVHDYNDVRLYNAYALALIDRGRYTEARMELERAARIAPDSREIQANLARLRAMGW
jgi:Flp pilus assembly protein TadD